MVRMLFSGKELEITVGEIFQSLFSKSSNVILAGASIERLLRGRARNCCCVQEVSAVVEEPDYEQNSRKRSQNCRE